jgi:hypothetical protein
MYPSSRGTIVHLGQRAKSQIEREIENLYLTGRMA